jgi:hypothetical protein
MCLDSDMEREIADEAKAERLMVGLCLFPGCDRDAEKGWSNCKRHFSAGVNAKVWLLMHEKRQRR